jgi:uncharacterized protein YegP (UPF0339 family)
VRFEIYMEDDRWHFKLYDNESDTVLARSHERGYDYRNAALQAVQAIKSGAASAWIDA